MSNGNGSSRLEVVKVAVLTIGMSLIVGILLGMVIPKINDLHFTATRTSHKVSRVVRRVEKVSARQGRLEDRVTRSEKRQDDIEQRQRRLAAVQTAFIVAVSEPRSEPSGPPPRNNQPDRQPKSNPKPKPKPEPRPSPQETCIPVVDVCI